MKQLSGPVPTPRRVPVLPKGTCPRSRHGSCQAPACPRKNMSIRVNFGQASSNWAKNPVSCPCRVQGGLWQAELRITRILHVSVSLKRISHRFDAFEAACGGEGYETASKYCFFSSFDISDAPSLMGWRKQTKRCLCQTASFSRHRQHRAGGSDTGDDTEPWQDRQGLPFAASSLAPSTASSRLAHGPSSSPHHERRHTCSTSIAKKSSGQVISSF